MKINGREGFLGSSTCLITWQKFGFNLEEVGGPDLLHAKTCQSPQRRNGIKFNHCFTAIIRESEGHIEGSPSVGQSVVC